MQLIIGHDEDDAIVPTIKQATADGGDAGDALRELLCTEPCARAFEAQGEVGLKKKKKKRKKKKSAAAKGEL